MMKHKGNSHNQLKHFDPPPERAVRPTALLFKALFWRLIQSEWRSLLLASISVALGLALALAVRLATQSPQLSFEQRLQALEQGGWIGPLRWAEPPAHQGRHDSARPVDVPKLLTQAVGSEGRIHVTWSTQSLLFKDRSALNSIGSQLKKNAEAKGVRRVVLWLVADEDFNSNGASDRLHHPALLLPDQAALTRAGIRSKRCHPELQNWGSTASGSLQGTQVRIQILRLNDTELRWVAVDSELLCSRLIGFLPERLISARSGAFFDLRGVYAAEREIYVAPPAQASLAERQLFQRQISTLASQVAGLSVSSASEKTADLASLTRSFDANLQIMGFIALVIGVFMVYHVLQALLVRHASTLSILRAMGFSHFSLLLPLSFLVFSIAIVACVFGSMIGVFLGTHLARMTQTAVQSLYEQMINPADFAFSLVDLGWGVLAGLLTCFGGAAAAFRKILRLDTAASLRTGTWVLQQRARSLRQAVVSRCVLFAACAAIVALAPAWPLVVNRLPVSAFVSCLAALCMGILFSEAAFWAVRLLLSRTASRGSGNFAVRISILLSVFLTPHSLVVVQVLVLALGLTIGVRTMVESFRFSLESWTERTMKAPIWMRSERGPLAPLPQEALRIARKAAQELSPMSQVERLQVRKGKMKVRGSSVGLPSLLNASDVEFLSRAGTVDWVMPKDAVAQERATKAVSESHNCRALLDDPCPVFLSEPAWIHLGLSRSHGRLADDLRVEFTIEGHSAWLKPVAVYRDFSADQGVIMLNYANATRLFPGIDEPFFLRISLRDESQLPSSAHIAQVVQQLRVQLNEMGLSGVQTFDLAEIKANVRRAFRETFRITDALYVMCLLVSLVTVTAALSLQLVLRKREWSILWATSSDRRGVGRALTMGVSFLGLLSGVLSIAPGLLLAWILVGDVNRYSFGFSLGWSVPLMFLAAVVCLATLSGLLASGLMMRLLGRQLRVELLTME